MAVPHSASPRYPNVVQTAHVPRAVRFAAFVLPVLVVFTITGIVFLLAGAPRTWADHWTNPSYVGPAAGQAEYGAVPGPRGWDLLWIDGNTMHVVLTRAGMHPQFADHGDAREPTLLRSRSSEFGVWIHDYNGSSALMGLVAPESGPARVFQILHTTQQLEHPYLFQGVNGAVDLIFSWQRRGNFENYLTTFDRGSDRPSPYTRLDSAQFYSFYPRAIITPAGRLVTLYLDSCCNQDVWNVTYRVYDSAGRSVARPRVLLKILGFGKGRPVPSQWGEDLKLDSRGNVWGAFSGDQGVWVFEADSHGHLLHRPVWMDPAPGTPEAATLALDSRGGYLFWEQMYDLGSFITVQRFDRAGLPTAPPERVAYGSGEEVNPHAGSIRGHLQVLWQTISKGLTTKFERAEYRAHVDPSIAQRLGLGLGNPWEEAGLLIAGAVGFAVLATVANILLIICLGAIGLVIAWILSKTPLGRTRYARWAILACLLAVVLYLSFVSPGGPVLFLDTMPGMGLSAIPYGILAAVSGLMVTFWVGAVAMRRIDDLYRIGVMVFLGVYLFAFAEAAVFVQQRLGYI